MLIPREDTVKTLVSTVQKNIHTLDTVYFTVPAFVRTVVFAGYAVWSGRGGRMSGIARRTTRKLGIALQMIHKKKSG